MTIHLRRAALCLALAAPLNPPAQVLAAPAPRSVAASSLGQSYRARVEAIARDLLWSSSLLLQSLEQYEKARASIEKPRRNTDAAALKAQADGAKATLLANIAAVRSNAGRLRAISPVPRAWKRLDDGLVEAAWEWSSALDSLELWLQHPSDALKLEAAKHSRRAQTLLDATRRELWTLSDHAVAGKNYAD